MVSPNNEAIKVMSFSIHGVGVSNGIAIGHAHLVSHALLEVVHYQVPQDLLEQEIKRFKTESDKGNWNYLTNFEPRVIA